MVEGETGFTKTSDDPRYFNDIFIFREIKRRFSPRTSRHNKCQRPTSVQDVVFRRRSVSNQDAADSDTHV
jgi:hypothetical protein